MVILATRLTARVQSNLGIIRGGAARGLSSSAINDLIRATGQRGIRRTDLLAGIRHAEGITASGSRIRSTRLDFFPNPALIEPGRGPMLSNFSYDVRVRAFDGRQGKVVNRFITVRSDRNLTPRMIQDEAREALEQAPQENESGQLSEIERMTVIGARRKA